MKRLRLYPVWYRYKSMEVILNKIWSNAENGLKSRYSYYTLAPAVKKMKDF
jgi:hypothetical protein